MERRSPAWRNILKSLRPRPPFHCTSKGHTASAVYSVHCIMRESWGRTALLHTHYAHFNELFQLCIIPVIWRTTVELITKNGTVFHLYAPIYVTFSDLSNYFFPFPKVMIIEWLAQIVPICFWRCCLFKNSLRNLPAKSQQHGLKRTAERINALCGFSLCC